MTCAGKSAVLFDLGNTLVQYYTRAEFPEVLDRAIAEVESYLRQEGLFSASSEDVKREIAAHNREHGDCQVRPLEERLCRIFGLGNPAELGDFVMAISRCFMKPIFALGRRYDDALPVLEELKSRGFKTAIVSNTPWGSPAELWREEVERLGLAALVDDLIFCRDVGWRKPARQIFDHTLERVRAAPKECIFVGDDPRWDLVGPRAVGIEAILIDREGTMQDSGEDSIRNLYELLDRL